MTTQALPLPNFAVLGRNPSSEVWGLDGGATIKLEGGPQDRK